jgi:hypothetical protein
MSDIEIRLYSENPSKNRELLIPFIRQAIAEGNDSIRTKNYNPDNPNLETWMCFLNNKLISISVAEKSHYTNDPDIAVRVCRYHILKDYRFTHCGLRMGEHQITWARERNFQILYITHNVKNRAINALYQRKKKIPVPTFNNYVDSEWYTKLTLENEFLFKTGDMLQYIYSIRLQDPLFKWQPHSDYIVREFDESLIKCS